MTRESSIEEFPVHQITVVQSPSRPCSVPPRSSSYHYAVPEKTSTKSLRCVRTTSKSADPTTSYETGLHSHAMSDHSGAATRRPRTNGGGATANGGIVSDEFPFPLQPTPTRSSNGTKRALDDDNDKPRRRRFSGVRSYPTPPTTPDRFIPDRRPYGETVKSFRLSKSPGSLSSSERLLRNNSASTDPFSSRRLPPNPYHSTSSQSPPPQHNDGGHSVMGPSVVGTQTRHVSAGGVWNFGGGQTLVPNGPMIGVSNGRGGVFGSGTNAPMFTSRFFETESQDQSLERFEGRLAVALEVDQTSRILSLSQSSDRCQISNPKFISNSRKPTKPTVWRDGLWVNDGPEPLAKAPKSKTRAVPITPFRVLDAPSLRDDFYCSVLAYCHTRRTLAVGLHNRVYLWSELAGVQYPRIEENLRNVYVTSLSFSSDQGGHSILATGRSNGQVSVWSLFDENDRFQTQQPHAVACVSFKPVTTRRFSEQSGGYVSIEELLVGDELGVVYYYSIEWAEDPSAGSMNLMAKIDIHTQQICGIAWSPEGDCFATGGNDNICCLFDSRDILVPPSIPVIPGPFPPMLTGFAPEFVPNASIHHTLGERLANTFDTNPPWRTARHPHSTFVPGRMLLTITEGRQRHKWTHSAAVKAIAFCPWQRGLLATGGGSNDRAIHFYHAGSAACLATIHVQAQVTSLIWSNTRREIVATFGYAQPEHPYRIAVYSWPDCRQVVAIPWAGEMRALYAIAYPGGPNETTRQRGEGGRWWSRTAEEGCIVVASSDESVKFHEVWSEARKSTGGRAGLLGGSDILQGLEGIDKEGAEVIR